MNTQKPNTPLSGYLFTFTSAILCVLSLLDGDSRINNTASFVFHSHSPVLLIVFINLLGVIWVVLTAYFVISGKRVVGLVEKCQLGFYLFTWCLMFYLYY